MGLSVRVCMCPSVNANDILLSACGPFLSNEQLRCSWGQRWVDYILISRGRGPRLRRYQISSNKHIAYLRSGMEGRIMNMLIITTSKILYKSTLFDFFCSIRSLFFPWHGFFRRVCHRGFFSGCQPPCGATIAWSNSGHDWMFMFKSSLIINFAAKVAK